MHNPESHVRLPFVSSAEDLSEVFRQLFDSMQEGFAIHEIICDEAGDPADYRFIDVNPAFEELTGIKRELIVGKTVKEVMPATEAYWIQRYGNVALTGEPARLEAFAEAIGRHYSVYTYSPGPKLFATLFSDVTDRVRAADSLREANESLEEKVRLRTVQLDAANQELTAHNEEVRAVNEELTAQNEEINALNEEIASLNSNLVAINEELEQRVEERTADLTAANQELTAQYAELTATQESLLQEKTFVEALLESVPGYLYVYDSQGTLVRWNKKHELMTGYSAEELSHMTLEKWFEGEDAARVAAAVETVFMTGYGEVEAHLLIKGGKKLHIRSNGVRLDIGGKTYFTGVGIDITEQVRRQEEIYNDARLAARVQNTLLTLPAASEYLDVTSLCQPYGYVGGDLYFLDWRYDGKLLRGFLVDVTGHGLSTALHTASLHVLLREVNKPDLPLSKAISWLNRRAGEYFDEATFAATIGFELDLQTRELRWVCAGIPKIMVSTQKRQGALECPGMCLGINESETFETHTLTIEVGDCFYFLTDGLSYLLEQRIQLPLDRYVEMVGLLRTLSESETRRDDATAVCIRVNSLPDSSGRTDGWPRVLRFNGYGDYQCLKGEVAKILAEVTGLPHSPQEVAVHEALANAMECRDGVPRQHKARLRFNRVGNRLIVRVKTSRIGFAGNAILKRLRSQPEDMFSFGEDASMGRGIPMMLSMSHKMTYNSEGTEVLLAWKLNNAKGSRGCNR